MFTVYPHWKEGKWMFSICSKIESKQTYLNWKHLWLKELFSMKTSGCTFKSLPNKRMLENLFYATHGHPCRCSLKVFFCLRSTPYFRKESTDLWVCSEFLILLEWPWDFEHVYFFPDKEQNMTDSAFDSFQVDNAKIEIMTVSGQIK